MLSKFIVKTQITKGFLKSNNKLVGCTKISTHRKDN